MLATWSGFIVFDVGAWGCIFAGAARAYFRGDDALGGLGVESKVKMGSRGATAAPAAGAAGAAAAPFAMLPAMHARCLPAQMRRLATIARSLTWSARGEVFTRVSTMRRLFLCSQALAWSGLAVLLGGVAGMQARSSVKPTLATASSAAHAGCVPNERNHAAPPSNCLRPTAPQTPCAMRPMASL